MKEKTLEAVWVDRVDYRELEEDHTSFRIWLGAYHVDSRRNEFAANREAERVRSALAPLLADARREGWQEGLREAAGVARDVGAVKNHHGIIAALEALAAGKGET